jgi:L-amino acid N-acyltransferase YncA
MRFYVEPSPAGGYHVKLRGCHAPISRHDTEEEARARRDAYARGAAAHITEPLALRDGSAVIIRPLEDDDQPLVQAVFRRMGEEARYRRFLAYKKRLSARDLKTLTAVDHHGHEALVALDAETGEALGVARMIRERLRPDTAEASVAVVDAWQGRGLGGLLLKRLVHRAREEGVRRFSAVLLTRNLAMLHLFERIGAARVTSRSGDSLELEVELPLDTGAPHEAVRAAAAGDVRG